MLSRTAPQNKDNVGEAGTTGATPPVAVIYDSVSHSRTEPSGSESALASPDTESARFHIEHDPAVRARPRAGYPRPRGTCGLETGGAPSKAAEDLLQSPGSLGEQGRRGRGWGHR